MVPIWNQSLESSQYGNMVGENGKHDLHLKSLRKLNEILPKLKMQGLLEKFGWWVWASGITFWTPKSSAYFSRCEMLGVSSFAKNSSPWMFFYPTQVIQFVRFSSPIDNWRSQITTIPKRVTNRRIARTGTPITLWFSDQKITIPKP